jgi:trk system potassium uptake protein TrkA
MRIVIVGAGKVGTYIAEDLLRTGHEIVIIERDRSRAEQPGRRELLTGAKWVIGDACEVTDLARAELQLADVLVAVTGDDEDNLVVSLLAKQEFAVPRVLARVNHPTNEWLFDELWGVDVAVSTPHLISALVEEALSVGSLVRLLQLAGGSVRLEEITLPSNSPLAGKTIAETQLPRGASIVAIVRLGHVVVPHGDTVLHGGDEVIVLLTDETEADVNRVLHGS